MRTVSGALVERGPESAELWQLANRCSTRMNGDSLMSSTMTELLASFFTELDLTPEQQNAISTGLVIDELDGWTNPAAAAVAPTTVSWADSCATTGLPAEVTGR